MNVPQDALSELSRLAESLKSTTPPTPGAAAARRLAPGYVACAHALEAQLRAADSRLSAPDAEDVVQGIAARLGELFDAWRGEGSFGAFLWTAARNDARQLLRRARGVEATEDSPAPEGHAADDADVVALRRYIWYRFGSPDNPERWVHLAGRGQRLAPASLLALQARLHGWSASWLVTNLQPRPDTNYWGPDRGELDRKWWRNRATLAYQQIQDELSGSAAERAHLAALAKALRDGT